MHGLAELPRELTVVVRAAATAAAAIETKEVDAGPS